MPLKKEEKNEFEEWFNEKPCYQFVGEKALQIPLSIFYESIEEEKELLYAQFRKERAKNKK